MISHAIIFRVWRTLYNLGKKMESICIRSCYCVAGQVFEVDFCGVSPSVGCLSSFEPFKTERVSVDLLFLLKVNASDFYPREEPLPKITDFSVDGVSYLISGLPGGGYQYRLTEEKNPGTDCYLESNADFSKVCVCLGGSALLQNYALSNFIMMAYAFSAATKGTLLMHASVIAHGGRGYLFLGKSGTGKSTHSRLWLEHISDTELLNDDNPVVRVEGSAVTVYGSPWSGKTPCYKNKSVPVGAFVRLRQKPENEISGCVDALAYASLVPSVSNMMWDDRVNDGICSSVSAIATLCRVYVLGCLPDKEAAFLCHDTVVK